MYEKNEKLIIQKGRPPMGRKINATEIGYSDGTRNFSSILTATSGRESTKARPASHRAMNFNVAMSSSVKKAIRYNRCRVLGFRGMYKI